MGPCLLSFPTKDEITNLSNKKALGFLRSFKKKKYVKIKVNN